MPQFLRIIFVTIIVTLLSQTTWAQNGVRYIDLPPYEALSKAQAVNKMLIVEFYAPWNNRSKWMHDKVLADSTVGEFVNSNFVATYIDTQTESGAQLALDYAVFSYPAIVVFDTRGNVLDKIDVALDSEDFRSRLLSLMLAADGSGGWQLRLCFSAVESGDIAQAHTYASEYLDQHTVDQVVNSVVWPLFSNNSITFYGSRTFIYMVDNIDLMRARIGRELVDQHLSDKILDAMLPFAVGTKDYDSTQINRLIEDAGTLALDNLSDKLKKLNALALHKQNSEINEVIHLTSYLIDHLPEYMSLQLTLGLDIVAEKGDKEQRNIANKIVTQTINDTNASAAYQLLENLRSRLK